jgi:hypothetical protein
VRDDRLRASPSVDTNQYRMSTHTCGVLFVKMEVRYSRSAGLFDEEDCLSTENGPQRGVGREFVIFRMFSRPFRPFRGNYAPGTLSGAKGIFLPGFMMPFGSSDRCIWRISVTAAPSSAFA